MATQSPVVLAPGVLPSRLKRFSRVADHSHPRKAEAKNRKSYNSA